MSLQILTALVPGVGTTPVIFLTKVPKGTIRSEHDANKLETELRARVYPRIESPMVILDGEVAGDHEFFGPKRLTDYLQYQSLSMPYWSEYWIEWELAS